MPKPSTIPTLASELEGAVMGLWLHLLQHTTPALSRTSASVLAMLDERPHRVTELAEAQAVAQPTMSVALQRLEANGFVTRERDALDRRVMNVAISDAGRSVLASRRASRAVALEERLRTLEPAARAAIAAAIPALEDLARPTTPIR